MRLEAVRAASGRTVVRHDATARLRLRVGAFGRPRQASAHVERLLAALRDMDERSQRMAVHATIVGAAVATAVASIVFGT
jgi:hypothetical protein